MRLDIVFVRGGSTDCNTFIYTQVEYSNLSYRCFLWWNSWVIAVERDHKNAEWESFLIKEEEKKYEHASKPLVIGWNPFVGRKNACLVVENCL